ncbi:MAG: hypothetical protein O7F71_06450 [Gammaproteobacteria bacterium]|nr:hypothetical protein [Gammaproteobacteria bacterium]
MPIEFRTSTVTIPNGTGRRSIAGSASFDSPIIKANVAINGFKLDYASADHHINVIEADTDIVSIDGGTVNFRVECNYADKNSDDPYSGYITALVIAEVE